MGKARLRIVFDSDDSAEFERIFEFPDLQDPKDRGFVASYIFSEVAAFSRWGQHFATLPNIDKLQRPVQQTFQPIELISGSYEDRVNTRAVWWDVLNVLLHVRALLAQAMAYDEQEAVQRASNEPEAANLSWHCHLNKLEKFDSAVGNLGKICDLVARLVFERLGATLMDTNKRHWDRNLKLSEIRDRLSDRNDPRVALLSDAEYQDLVKILDAFLSTDDVRKTRNYRNRVTHHVRPSVDRTELYSRLESRKKTEILDENGKIKGWSIGFGGTPSVAEYSFADLRESAVKNFGYYISLLERLDAMPRFSLEAIAPSAP